MTEQTIAVDLGGTHIRVALVAGDGSIVVRERASTPAGDPAPTIIPELIGAVMARGPGDAKPRRAVVGLAGVIDHETERLVAAPNLPEPWIPTLSDDWLTTSTGLDVALANDADLAAVGEAQFGAGRPYRDVVYVTISTGVGAGVVVAESLVRGKLSGGEVGHTVIDRVAGAEGRPCTVEELGSGTAIERAAAAAGIEARGADLADLVRGGHQPAVEVWTNAIEAVGLGIANLAWIVAPQVVVIGGGVGMNGDLVIPIVERQLQAYGPASVHKDHGPIDVVTAALGDDAALAGAAAWWRAIGRG